MTRDEWEIHKQLAQAVVKLSACVQEMSTGNYSAMVRPKIAEAEELAAQALRELEVVYVEADEQD